MRDAIVSIVSLTENLSCIRLVRSSRRFENRKGSAQVTNGAFECVIWTPTSPRVTSRSNETRCSFLRLSDRRAIENDQRRRRYFTQRDLPRAFFPSAETADPNAWTLVPRFKVPMLAVSPLSWERERCLFLNLPGALFVPRFGRVISRFVMIAGGRPAFIAAALAACDCCFDRISRQVRQVPSLASRCKREMQERIFQ